MLRLTILLILTSLVLGACSPADVLTPTVSPTPRMGELTPYTPPAASQTATPASGATPTPLPSGTPTPINHIIQEGEDMFGLAYRYGLPLDALMTANPTINPRAMRVGSVMVIPYSDRPTPTSQNPSPTPLPVEVGQPACFHAQDGSLTCLLPVFNGTGSAVENLTGSVRLRVQPGGEIQEVTAYPGINRLAAGTSLPLVAYLAAPAPQDVQASGELITALPVAEDDPRYLDASLSETSVQIGADGLSAAVSGQVVLDGSANQAAETVWVLAVAYNAAGQMVGVRRWENSAALEAGQTMDFELEVYSLGDAITRVETLVEARP
jgi:hypothetical protein